MSQIQGWVLQICIVCIIVSVILTFIKNEKTNNGIKTVLALYILVSALTPITVKGVSDSTPIPQIELNPISVDEIVKNRASNSLSQDIDSYLKDNGISAKCHEILFDETMNEVKQIKIYIYNEDDEKAIAAIHEYLGKNIVVIAEKEG